jgi:hypothetical protein
MSLLRTARLPSIRRAPILSLLQLMKLTSRAVPLSLL